MEIKALDGFRIEGASLSVTLARFPRKIDIDSTSGNLVGNVSILKDLVLPHGS